MKMCLMCDERPRKAGRSAKYCDQCTSTGYPSKSSTGTRARNHGLTYDQLDLIEQEQGGRCAICGQVPEGKALAVDHDHSCCPGKHSCGECVRGLLCDTCNRGLGFFKDNPKLLQSAIAYLEGEKY